jgi:hypothetical protein
MALPGVELGGTGRQSLRENNSEICLFRRIHGGDDGWLRERTNIGKSRPHHKLPCARRNRRGKPLDQSYIRSGGTTRISSRQEIGTMMLHSRTPRREDLHASVLRSDDELTAAPSVNPFCRCFNSPHLRARRKSCGGSRVEAFIERHSPGGGYITNLGAISAAARLSMSRS